MPFWLIREFVHFTKKVGDIITAAKDAIVKKYSRGTILLHVRDSKGSIVEWLIQDTLYVPNANATFISVAIINSLKHSFIELDSKNQVTLINANNNE
jgi:hypothetical protein